MIRHLKAIWGLVRELDDLAAQLWSRMDDISREIEQGADGLRNLIFAQDDRLLELEKRVSAVEGADREFTDHEHPHEHTCMGEHGHHWHHASVENSSGYAKHIYKCANCGAVETHK